MNNSEQPLLTQLAYLQCRVWSQAASANRPQARLQQKLGIEKGLRQRQTAAMYGTRRQVAEGQPSSTGRRKCSSQIDG